MDDRGFNFVSCMRFLQGCEAVAAQLGRQLDIPERYNVPRTTQADSQSQAAGRAAAEKPRGGISREEAVAELKRLPGAGRGVLSEAVARGVGFHHAGDDTPP